MPSITSFCAYTALHRSGIYQRNTLLIGEGRPPSAMLPPFCPAEAGIIWWAMSPRGCSNRAARLGGYDDLESVLAVTPVDRPSSPCLRMNIRLDHIICLCENTAPLRIIPAMRNASAADRHQQI
ncbi:MAG: hypothetical protein ACLS6G_13750 [Christensenellales bacterium]